MASQKVLNVNISTLTELAQQAGDSFLGSHHASRPVQREMLRELQGSGSSFAQTGHAMRLLEGVGVALQHLEPALLVGETGTGKTTLVQRLADQVTSTTAFNMLLCLHPDSGVASFPSCMWKSQ